VIRAALACACVLLVAGCAQSRDAAAPPSEPAPASTVSALDRLPQGWTRLAPPPLHRASAATVWTGSELILWGGDTQADAVHHADGARWDAETDAWTQVPDAPIAGRSQPASAWTGEELLVWGGTASGPLADGAAYDPATDAWRELPPAPLSPRVPVVGVWTGRAFLVWGDESREERARDGAAYDPATNRWRLITEAPESLNLATGAWTGRELVVVGSALDNSNRADTKTARALAYDPETDSWRSLPAPPLSPQASTAAPTAEGDVLAWDYELRAASWTGDEWRDEPALPLDFGECYPESATVPGGVVGWYCGVGAFFDAGRREWTPIPRRTGFFAGPVAAGPAVLFLGPGLWAYRPEG
jgi:hypothetical protein